jgi:hypothetical protein
MQLLKGDKGWWSGSSGSAPAWQAWGSGFKPKDWKKKKLKGDNSVTDVNRKYFPGNWILTSYKAMQLEASSNPSTNWSFNRKNNQALFPLGKELA